MVTTPPASPSQLQKPVVQRKNIKRGTRVYRLEFRSRVDKPFIPSPTLTHQDCDVLLAIGGECHRRRVDATTRVEAPKLLQRLCIQSRHLTVRLAVEHQGPWRQRD